MQVILLDETPQQILHAVFLANPLPKKSLIALNYAFHINVCHG